MAALIDAYILRCDYDGTYRGYIWRVENTVKAFQSYINCTLLRVVSLTPEIVIICQDAAKLWQFSFNPDPLNRAWMDGEKIHDFFRGNILCVRRSRSGNEFASIKHEDIAEIERRLLPLKTISEGEGYSDFVIISADHCPEWRPFYEVYVIYDADADGIFEFSSAEVNGASVDEGTGWAARNEWYSLCNIALGDMAVEVELDLDAAWSEYENRK